jgi:hypothetical protein
VDAAGKRGHGWVRPIPASCTAANKKAAKERLWILHGYHSGPAKSRPMGHLIPRRNQSTRPGKRRALALGVRGLGWFIRPFLSFFDVVLQISCRGQIPGEQV